ncbi:hypothetical protein AB4876_03345 [Zhongshania guokunii]|uniref:Uncharacterized protein n=1 Tax=Zhongshania guokunii TaxID=641783 RepID=A0ABV3U4I9_9GAMM
MKEPDDKPPANTPFEQVGEKPTSKRQFGSHRGDWWLDVSYSEDIDMNKAIDTKAAREKLKP